MTEIDEIVANIPLTEMSSRFACRRKVEELMPTQNETIKTQVVDALWELYIERWPHDLFIKRLLEVTSDTRTGCILRAMFNDPRQYHPRYDRNAIITSDGYIMCGYTDRNGDYYAGAFVGSAFDLTRQLISLCVFARLNGDEMLALGDAADSWIGTDYRAGAVYPPRLILNTEESARATQDVMEEIKRQKEV
jgi:hypothetical protein